MPYGIRKRGSKTQVYNRDSGEVYGSHSSKAKAKDQLTALRIHTKHGGKLPRMTEVFKISESPMDTTDDKLVTQADARAELKNQAAAITKPRRVKGQQVKQQLQQTAAQVDPNKTFTSLGNTLMTQDNSLAAQQQQQGQIGTTGQGTSQKPTSAVFVNALDPKTVK